VGKKHQIFSSKQVFITRTTTTSGTFSVVQGLIQKGLLNQVSVSAGRLQQEALGYILPLILISL
jgi:hypothetical protein